MSLDFRDRVLLDDVMLADGRDRAGLRALSALADGPIIDRVAFNRIHAPSATTCPERNDRPVRVVQSLPLPFLDVGLDLRNVLGVALLREPLPEIVTVKIAPRAWSADYIDAINRKTESTLPNPRLPEFTDTTSGGN